MIFTPKPANPVIAPAAVTPAMGLLYSDAMAGTPARRSREGPFRPGPGGPPPYLAGREAEQALFRNLIADLADGLAPASEVILWGPRGNGKTALLCWLEDEAAKMRRLDVLWVTPSAIPEVSELIGRILPWWKRLTPTALGDYGFSVRFGGVPGAALDRVLERRARRRPLLLLVDEAHTLEGEVGRALLNASQRVGRRFPFLLVLAGTPDLETRLGSLNASFWGRARQLPVNRLDDEAAAAAIRKPMEADGVAIPDDLLARIIRDSHGYPYFLQLLGEALWQRVTRGGGSGAQVVDEADLAAAEVRFEEQKAIYYRQRHSELKERHALAPAVAVAEAFGGSMRLSDRDLEEAVRRGPGGAEASLDPGAAQRELRHLGVIWQPGFGLDWEPGIPSFMEFVREQGPSPTGE